ncbi:MAG: hypothetical protein ACQEVA_10700 [Myxococcota bacterium]
MANSKMRNVYISGLLSVTPLVTIVIKTHLAPDSGLIPTDMLSSGIYNSTAKFVVAAAILSSLIVQLGYVLHVLGANDELNLVGRLIWISAIFACLTPIAVPLYWYLHVFSPYRADYMASREKQENWTSEPDS